MKALVTGANGFLGRHVVAALLARGHRVRALVRPGARLEGLGWPGSVEVARADLRAPGDLSAAFEGVDVLIHLAAAVTGGEDAQLSAAVVGTERLLSAMAATPARRLVFAGSFSVYDWSAAGGVLDEETPIEPAPDLYERDGYAVAKIWQERVARRAAEAHGWGLTILRPGFIWGRGNEHLACLGQAAGPFYLAIGPRTRLPLTHVENCADCFASAAEGPDSGIRTFNVVDSDDVRTWRYLGDYLRGSGRRAVRVPIPYAAARLAVGAASRLSKIIFRGKGKLPSLLVPCRFEARFKPLRYSNRRAREGLGWAPRLDYDACLRRTFGPAEPRPLPLPSREPTTPQTVTAEPVGTDA